MTLDPQQTNLDDEAPKILGEILASAIDEITTDVDHNFVESE